MSSSGEEKARSFRRGDPVDIDMNGWWLSGTYVGRVPSDTLIRVATEAFGVLKIHPDRITPTGSDNKAADACGARPCRNGDHYGQCYSVTAPYFRES